MYEPGETIPLHADIYPAAVALKATGMRPEGVPPGAKLRAIITRDYLTLAWQHGSGPIQRLDIPLTEEQSSKATYMGGDLGDYVVGITSGCKGCGPKGVVHWQPFPGVIWQQVPRVAEAVTTRGQRTGLIPKRYSRG